MQILWGRASFYRWKAAYKERGEAGLVTRKQFERTLTIRHRPKPSKGALFTQQTSPRVDKHRLASGAMSRNQNL